MPESTQLSPEIHKKLLVDVLPVILSEDSSVRVAALEFLEKMLPSIRDVKNSFFDEMRPNVSKYAEQIEKMFTANDERWYRYWCLVVDFLGANFLNRDVINSYLKIVEKGFRSADMKRRSESFLCWKALIDHLVRHNDIKKRIKLILIPLKGSKTKTLDIAERKFEVWWTFLQAIEPNSPEFNEILEDFICYCFGPLSNEREPLWSYFGHEKPPMKL